MKYIYAIFICIVCIPMMSSKGRYDVYSYGVERNGIHYTVYAHRMSDLAIRYREESEYGDVRFWTNYTWNSATTNILINASNYPTITAGDTVFITTRSGGAGYRSYSLNGINSGAPNQYIVVYWLPNTYITTNTSSPIQANSIDNIYGVKTVHMTMNDNIDVAFTFYSSGNYSKYVWFDSCTYRGMNGFFPSSPQTLTTPNFTGDTTNCFYYWHWSYCSFDSLVGGNSGQTGMWIGNINKKDTWVHVEIDHCYFGDYSASGQPSTYIRASNVYGLYIHHDSLWNLGKNVVSPVGHAAQIFVRSSYYEIYDCYFGPNNFGNCIRSFGQTDIPSMAASFAQWSAGYTGRSRIYNCIDVDSRKYPFFESQPQIGDTTTLSPYVRYRTFPEIWFVSCIRLDTWSPNDSYAASVVDNYEPDSLFLKGSYLCGPSDTVWAACGAKACIRLITLQTASTAVWDTARTRFVSSSLGIGMFDSVNTFHPNYGSGLLYGQGPTSYPSWCANDYYGNPRGATPDIGAVQSITPPTGIKNVRLNKVRAFKRI